MTQINTRSNELPMLSTLMHNPLMASTISKAVDQPSNSGASSIRDAKTGALVSLSEMHQMSTVMQQSIQNYESFFQLFPDMNIDRSIVVGGVLAPNNMFREELNYSIENKEVDALVAGQVIDLVRREVDTRYQFVQDLREIVDNALFNRGSHVKLVIPESAVDYLINSTTNLGGMRMESAEKFHNLFDQNKPKFSLGLLANPEDKNQKNLTFRGESWRNQANSYNPVYQPVNKKWEDYPEMKELASKGLFSLTDDFSIIKKPFYVSEITREVVRDRIDAQRKGINTFRTESVAPAKSNVTDFGEQAAREARMDTLSARDQHEGDISLSKLQASIFKAAPNAQEFFARIPRLSNLKRHSIGACMCIDAPSEAFIPIHYPGQPKEHLGYFALIDPSTGYFISLESQRQTMASFNSQINPTTANVSSSTGGTSGMASSLVNKAAQNLVNADQSRPLRYHPEIFGALLVEDYLERLQAGPLGFQMEAKMSTMLGYVMMARANAGRQTQVLFIPADFVSYFAFDHNADGTGRSMLAGVTNLLSLRAAALYSRVANQIRNAISITDVNVTLDERDHQPQRTLMKVVDLVTQSRAQFFPWGLNNASDIWSWWNRAGFQLNIEGHPALPKTKVAYEHRTNDHSLPDIADDGYLKDMVGHHLGVTPEMKDAGSGADFATSVVNNNILFATREHGLQLKLNPQLTSHVRKLVYNDSEIFSGVRGIIADNWGKLEKGFSEKFAAVYKDLPQDDAIDNFMRVVIDSLTAKLPPPEVTTIQNQSQAYKEFSEAVDEAFDGVLKDEALSKMIFGNLVAQSVELALIAKAQAKRNWMQKNGYMTELLSVAEVDENGKSTSKLLRQGVDFALRFAKSIIAVHDEFKATGRRAELDIGVRTGDISPEEAQEQLALLINPVQSEANKRTQEVNDAQQAETDQMNNLGNMDHITNGEEGQEPQDNTQQ